MSRLIDLDEFLRQNCVDRMEGKSCDECKHHVLEVSCERLMEQPTAEKVGKWTRHILKNANVPWGYDCSACGEWFVIGEDTAERYNYCPNCGARMREDGGEG